MLEDLKKNILLVILVIIIVTSSFTWYEAEGSNENNYEVINTKTSRLTKEEAKNYTHEIIGELVIPKANIDVPIMQAQSSGTDNYAMNTTVAHDSTTGLPGDGEPIVISGHREKEFYKLYDVKKDMIAIVKIGNNISYYKVTEVGEFPDNAIQTVFGGEEEELRLYTCYPRASGSYVSARYGVKALPITKEEVPNMVLKSTE